MFSSKQFHAALLRGQCGSIPLLRDAAMYVSCAQSSTSTTTLCSSQSQQYFSCGKEEWQTSIRMKRPHLMPSSCGVSGIFHHTRVVLAPNGASGDNDSEKTAKREKKRKPRWTLDSTIKEVLFEGEGQVPNMKLNDFLRSELAGRGVVEENENLAMAAFVLGPRMFIQNEELLSLIMGLPSYQAYQDHVILCNALSTLQQEGVHSLRQWKDYNGKEKIHLRAKGMLNAALDAVQKVEEKMKEALEGLYESVYDAKWSHVVEVPGGEGMGMEIRGGEPQESWTFKKSDGIPELDESTDQFSYPRCRLMVLTSKKEWPYSLGGRRPIFDCFVNTEVERVWQLVKGDLTGKLRSKEVSGEFVGSARVLIGTPGIGKSMGVGSYLLYQLLHCRDPSLDVIIYCFGFKAYVFDRATEKVTWHKGEDNIEQVVIHYSNRGKIGYIIYDVAEQGKPPARRFGAPATWGMILLTSPNPINYKDWDKHEEADRIFMNCPHDKDVKAMCFWMKRDESEEEQLKEWNIVKERIGNVGEIPRCIFNDKQYDKRLEDIKLALSNITHSNADHYIFRIKNDLSSSDNVSHKLVKLIRRRGEGGVDSFANTPSCVRIRNRILTRLTEVGCSDVMMQVLQSKEFMATAFEIRAIPAFVIPSFVDKIHKRIRALDPPGERRAQPCVLTSTPELHPTTVDTLPALESKPEEKDIRFRVLYLPQVGNYPLVDGLFFVEEPTKKTMVGLQSTTAMEHPTKASTIKDFKSRMSQYFKDWDNVSKDLCWQIIYVQHTMNTEIKRRQRCDLDKESSKENESHKKFWDDTVYQYQVSVSTKDMTSTQ